VLSTQLRAAAAVGLPQRSPTQLLVDVQSSNLTGVSGTVVEKADLGLPALPDSLGGSGSSQLNSLVSGSHTLRVWYSGPDRTRVALLGARGESDIIRNGNDAWIWSSSSNTATHFALNDASAPGSSGATKGAMTHALPTLTDMPTTPQQAAEQALMLLGTNTTVSTESSTQVAGRPAYLLSLTPKDPGSLIAKIRVAIDSASRVPTRVEVFAKGTTDAAFSIGFSQVSFSRPDAERFAFTPPPGAQVSDETGNARTLFGGAQPQNAVIGSGWSSVLATRLPPATAAMLTGTGATAGGDAAVLSTYVGMLHHVDGAWGGGRLLQSGLFSVLITDDGRVLVGAVSGDRLEQAAADPAAALK
jgi:outer membrane lipoprotein-sorting protein